MAAKKTDQEREREKRALKKELICHTHDKIKAAAEQIAMFELSNMTLSEVMEAEDEIRNLAEYIAESIDYALERGQAMEDRLTAYSDAIENLGFKRRK